MSVKEIREMISTATIGDGDQLLNILEKVCDEMEKLRTFTERVERKANQAVERARSGPTRY